MLKGLFVLSVLCATPAFAGPAFTATTAICTVRTIKQYRPQIDLPQRLDKFKHCALSCIIALQCGPVESWGAGVIKELADLIGPGDPDWKDLRADRMGIQLMRRGYARTPQDC